MKAPFCKVCFDTGKPESLYTNHYVNDIPGKNGVVVCPTLLSLECRYCREKGHTVSRCKMIKKKRITTKSSHTATNKSETTKDRGTIMNRFSALEKDDQQVVMASETTTYASVLLTRGVVQLEEAQVILPPLRLFIPRSPSCSPPPLIHVKKVLNWAESFDTDSDTD